MTIGVTGHQRLRKQTAKYVAEMMRPLLAQSHPLVGVSALAAGSDQLFAAEVIRASGTLHVVVPCRTYETTFDTYGDLMRYHEYLERATVVEVLDFASPSEEAFLAAGKRVVDLVDLLLAVWDGQPARGKGGTADVVEYAESRSVEVRVIWPSGVAR